MDVRKALVIAGPPYAGKGTMSKLLAQTGMYVHLSTGEMIRSLDEGTEIGRKSRQTTDEGNYVSDELMFEILDFKLPRYLTQHNSGQTILLDGIPRTIPQIAMVNERFSIEQVLYLDAPEGVLKQRWENRLSEESRQDDRISGALEHRLAIYRRETEPMLYQLKPVRIDASGTEKEVYAAVLAAIKNG